MFPSFPQHTTLPKIFVLLTLMTSSQYMSIPSVRFSRKNTLDELWNHTVRHPDTRVAQGKAAQCIKPSVDKFALAGRAKTCSCGRRFERVGASRDSCTVLSMGSVELRDHLGPRQRCEVVNIKAFGSQNRAHVRWYKAVVELGAD